MGIKTLKSNLSPTLCTTKDKRGNHMPDHEYARKATGYLEEVQWKKKDNLPQQKEDQRDFPETKSKIKSGKSYSE